MRAVIDRFEGNYAVLLVGESEVKVDLPQSILPPGAREGSILDLSLELREEETRDTLEQMRKRIERLKGKGEEGR